jgi:plastocyanin
VSHNVVFDPVPGAPDGITQNGTTTSANRVFPTAGVFTFTCTIHGETGMVTVVAP